MGILLQVNIGPGGVPKHPVLLGQVTKTGFEGDRFAHPNIHGGPSQAILLIANEVIEELTNLGYPVYPGALGENLTTSGFDHRQWRQGQQFRAGAIRLELTKPRAPCRTLDVYGVGRNGISIQRWLYDSAVKANDPSSERWGRGGFYARVLTPGTVAAGDPFILESESA